MKNITKDIAIIGMAGKFPGSDNISELWKNIIENKVALRRFAKDEPSSFGVPTDLLEQPNYIPVQYAINSLKEFDHDFFGYSSKEADIMDPQHRIFLQCVWNALEDANINPYSYSGSIGVYAGCGKNNYLEDYVLPSFPKADLPSQYQMMIHNQNNFLSTKAAYKLNLKGPALNIQTACSTSLVAVHQACLALRAGDCDVAVAGAVSLGQLEPQGYLYQEGMIFSKDGYCRAFDKDADGTVEGQGIGIIILKLLSKALKNNDHIYAIIKGSALNNDGSEKIGYTAPSPQKQAEVIMKAHEFSNVLPDNISYVEAHGTGTILGDPIEIEGLKKAFQNASNKASCALGSIKPNIGHLDVAAGIAGLIKSVLCLYHKKIPPLTNFKELNPHISLSGSPFYIPTSLTGWNIDSQKTRIAGVSSFGIGGTNAHVILEEADNDN